MDRFEAMETLLAVVSAGSLSAAARSLGKPLPTVSRHLGELEAHLGTRLLDRSTRRLTLTEAGEEYVQSARRILADVNAAERAAAGEYRTPKGELSITAPILLGRLHLVPIITEFLAAYPEIVVNLRLTPRTINLQEEQIDCGIRIGPLPDSSLIGRRLARVRRVIGASPAYLERRGRPQTLADLAVHDCITYSPLLRAETWRFQDMDVAVHSRLVVDEMDTVAAAAVAGAGIACLFSYHIARYVRDGRLKLILEDFEPPPVPVSLVHLPGSLQTQKLRVFMAFAVPRLQRSLSE